MAGVTSTPLPFSRLRAGLSPRSSTPAPAARSPTLEVLVLCAERVPTYYFHPGLPSASGAQQEEDNLFSEYQQQCDANRDDIVCDRHKAILMRRASDKAHGGGGRRSPVRTRRVGVGGRGGGLLLGQRPPAKVGVDALQGVDGGHIAVAGSIDQVVDRTMVHQDLEV